MIDLNENKPEELGWGRSHHEAQQPDRPKTKALWVGLALLAVVVVGAAGYGYRTLRKHNIRLSQLPGPYLRGRLRASVPTNVNQPRINVRASQRRNGCSWGPSRELSWGLAPSQQAPKAWRSAASWAAEEPTSGIASGSG